MKKTTKIQIIILILIVLLSNMIFATISNAADTDITMTFKDDQLYRMIVSGLWGKLISQDDDTNTFVISKEKADTVDRMDLYWGDVKDISDIGQLKQFVNLKNMYFSSSLDITDASGIFEIESLEYLTIAGTGITNLAGIEKLVNLKSLNITGNKINDISGIEKLTKLQSLNATDNQIENIESLKTLTELYSLILDENKVQDVSSLVDLTNLNWLTLRENDVKDITSLTDLKKLEMLNLYENEVENADCLKDIKTLEEIDLRSNNITNTTALSELNNLERLFLDNNNITDINNVLNTTGNLTSLKQIHLNDNKIESISNIDQLFTDNNLNNFHWIAMRNNNISDMSDLEKVDNSKVYTEISGQQIKVLTNKTTGIELPKLVQESQVAGTIYYCGTGIQVENCTISSDNTTVDLADPNITGKIKIDPIWNYKGVAGTEITIETDFVAPLISSSNTPTESTNGTVQVTIVSNEPLQKLSGWNLSNDKLSLTKSYDKNLAETVTVLDLAGNQSSVQVVVNNIDDGTITPDTTPPVLGINLTPDTSTTGTVFVTISSNEPIQPVAGWTLASDKLSIGKQYTKNTTETIKVLDLFGNESAIEVVVNNIQDTTPPTLGINLTPDTSTTGTVFVTISSNEPIQAVAGWTLASDKLSLSKEYDKNTTETIKVLDLSGNESSIEVVVNNIETPIDTTPPVLGISLTPNTSTTGTVIVTISSNEPIQAVAGWTLASDKLSLSKEYTKNTTETIKVLDLSGNESSIEVVVNNIQDSSGNSDNNNSGNNNSNVNTDETTGNTNNNGEETLLDKVLPFTGIEPTEENKANITKIGLILLVVLAIVIVEIIKYRNRKKISK